jgi:hypothetical protein
MGLSEHWREAAWALLFAVLAASAFDLVSPDSRIRAGIRYLKNAFAEMSVGLLRKRISGLEIYRDALRSDADKATYLTILRTILSVVVLLCIAVAGIIADSMGLQGGRAVAACILAYAIGTGLGALQFYSPQSDTKKKFQRVISKLDRSISTLQAKLNKRKPD